MFFFTFSNNICKKILLQLNMRKNISYHTNDNFVKLFSGVTIFWRRIVICVTLIGQNGFKGGTTQTDQLTVQNTCQKLKSDFIQVFCQVTWSAIWHLLILVKQLTKLTERNRPSRTGLWINLAHSSEAFWQWHRWLEFFGKPSKMYPESGSQIRCRSEVFLPYQNYGAEAKSVGSWNLIN